MASGIDNYVFCNTLLCLHTKTCFVEHTCAIEYSIDLMIWCMCACDASCCWVNELVASNWKQQYPWKCFFFSFFLFFFSQKCSETVLCKQYYVALHIWTVRTLGIHFSSFYRPQNQWNTDTSNHACFSIFISSRVFILDPRRRQRRRIRWCK